MEWPSITILIVTYKRPSEVRGVIEALQDKLIYPGVLLWRLADDCTGDNYVPDILRDFPNLAFEYTITPKRSGWGINVNTGLRAAGPGYVFQIEDDQIAYRSIDLENGVFVMEHDQTVGLVRYDGIEGHRLMLFMDETPKVDNRRSHFLRIMRRKTKGLNAYSNRPHLKHPRFHGVYGGYPEGLSMGSTEEVFAHHILHQPRGTPDLVALANGVQRAFRHVGTSRQLTDADIGQRVEWEHGSPA